MSFKNNSIRNYFKSSLHPPKAPVAAEFEKRDGQHIDSISAETTDGDAEDGSLLESMPAGEGSRDANFEDSDHFEAIPFPESAIIHSSRDRVINGSDEEDSNSDSSVEDIYVALQQQSRPNYSNSANNDSKSPEKSRSRNKRSRILVQPSPAKPKYKFDMKTLMEQAERHKATEASAVSMNLILDAADNDSQGKDEAAACVSILQSVIAEKEKGGVDPGKFLLAVKRTEATQSERGCNFFDSARENSSTACRLPAFAETDSWKATLANPRSRNQVLLSGFARDMVVLEGTLDNNIFEWMLGEICFERRNDLREAYCKVLEAAEDQMGSFISHGVIKSLLKNLGAKKAAYDITEEVKLISKDQSPYEGHDWTTLSAVIAFIGRNSTHLTMETLSYTMCVLARLCIDSVVIQNMKLLAAVQNTMKQLCGRIEASNWDTICQETCASTFRAIKLPALQLQILRCIPQTTTRVHELRRRLALAFFFKEAKYISSTPHESLDLSEVTEQLKKSQFIINRDTDYSELAAVMSILDIAIDNGLSIKHDVTDTEGEVNFNREVDVLAARIKQIWGSINDAGAAFMSRSYAKEMMDGLRMRLELTIRTKPKPKLSIFETEEPDNDRVVLKQTTISRKLFQRKLEDEGTT